MGLMSSFFIFAAPPICLRTLPLLQLLQRHLCCLRCAKHISTDPAHVCVMPVRSNKCTRCSALHKAYDAIPDAVTPYARRLLAAAADYVAKYDEDDGSDESVAALAALVEMQNDFTRRAEAAVRLRRRFGLNRRPTSTMEVALAVLESSQRIEALLSTHYKAYST
jgi:hypothetical protein